MRRTHATTTTTTTTTTTRIKKMNIEDLTIGQARELAKLFGGSGPGYGDGDGSGT